MIWVLPILGLFAVILWYAYQKHAAPEFEGQVDGPDDVREAAELLGYKSRPGIHPIDCIQDARLAAAAAAVRAAEIDGMLTSKEIATVLASLRDGFGLDETRARAMATLSHWIAAQCPSQRGALRHLSKRCKALSGATLRPVIHDVAARIAACEHGVPHTDAVWSLNYIDSCLTGPSKGRLFASPKFAHQNTISA